MWGRVQTKDGRLPVERSGHSVAIDHNNDIVYFWGGQRAGRFLNDLFAFDASTCMYYLHLHLESTHSFYRPMGLCPFEQ